MGRVEYPFSVKVVGRLTDDSYDEGIRKGPDALQSPRSNGWTTSSTASVSHQTNEQPFFFLFKEKLFIFQQVWNVLTKKKHKKCVPFCASQYRDMKQQMYFQHSNIGGRGVGGLNHNTALVICQHFGSDRKGCGDHASQSRGGIEEARWVCEGSNGPKVKLQEINFKP